jgi:hypothetical protein
MERTSPLINSLGRIIGEDMKAPNSRVLISIVIFLAVSGLHAQNGVQPSYLNRTLSPQQRAADLVRRMTVEEKASQLAMRSTDYQDAPGVSNAENCMVRDLWNRERFGESSKVLHCSSV